MKCFFFLSCLLCILTSTSQFYYYDEVPFSKSNQYLLSSRLPKIKNINVKYGTVVDLHSLPGYENKKNQRNLMIDKNEDKKIKSLNEKKTSLKKLDNMLGKLIDFTDKEESKSNTKTLENILSNLKDFSITDKLRTKTLNDRILSRLEDTIIKEKIEDSLIKDTLFSSSLKDILSEKLTDSLVANEFKKKITKEDELNQVLNILKLVKDSSTKDSSGKTRKEILTDLRKSVKKIKGVIDEEERKVWNKKRKNPYNYDQYSLYPAAYAYYPNKKPKYYENESPYYDYKKLYNPAYYPMKKKIYSSEEDDESYEDSSEEDDESYEDSSEDYSSDEDTDEDEYDSGYKTMKQYYNNFIIIPKLKSPTYASVYSSDEKDSYKSYNPRYDPSRVKNKKSYGHSYNPEKSYKQYNHYPSRAKKKYKHKYYKPSRTKKKYKPKYYNHSRAKNYEPNYNYHPLSAKKQYKQKCNPSRASIEK